MIGSRAPVDDGMRPVSRFRYRKRRSRTGPRRWIDRAVSAGWMARIFSLDVNNTVVPSTPLDLRLGEWDGGNLDVPRPPGTLGVRYRGNATGGKSSLTVAATDIGDAPKAPDPFNLRLNGRLLQCPHAAMEAARPGSRSRSTDVFVGGSRPARNAPPVKPSAQPFSPRPRSTDGVHIDQSGTNLEPTWNQPGPAYGRLYSNQGATTKGTTAETADGIPGKTCPAQEPVPFDPVSGGSLTPQWPPPSRELSVPHS